MVAEGCDIGPAQLPSHDLTVPPRQAVDNPREAWKRPGDELNDVLNHLLGFLGHHNVLQVGSVEALSKPVKKCQVLSLHTPIRYVFFLPFACLVHVELVKDVCPDSWSSSGRQGHDGDSGEILPELTQLLVVWPKVVPPLTDAVGLIDHKPSQHLTRVKIS